MHKLKYRRLKVEYSWVENVNNQSIGGGKTGEWLYTKVVQVVLGFSGLVVQVGFMNKIFHKLQYQLSTCNIYEINLLNYSYEHNPQALLLSRKKKN